MSYTSGIKKLSQEDRFNLFENKLKNGKKNLSIIEGKDSRILTHKSPNRHITGYLISNPKINLTALNVKNLDNRAMEIDTTAVFTVSKDAFKFSKFLKSITEELLAFRGILWIFLEIDTEPFLFHRA